MADDYAIVIGINNYAAKGADGFRSLNSPIRDASKFMEWLRSPDGGGIEDSSNGTGRRIFPIFSPAMINSELPSPMDAKPVKDEIDNALMEIGLAGNATIGRRLYFYFSGHGLGISSDGIAMMMANAIRAMESRNIGLKNNRKYLQERDFFKEVVFIADCCRNRDTRPIELGTPPFVTPPANALPLMKDVAILAAEYGEPAYAISDGHGLLTEALIEGLKGHPDAVDQLGRVTTSTLSSFLPKTVASLAKSNFLHQEPEVNAYPNKSEIVLAVVDRKVPVKIIAADHVSGDIVVLYGDNTEIARRDANQARRGSPWEIDLTHSSIPYLVRAPGHSSNPMMLSLSDVKGNNNEFPIP